MSSGESSQLLPGLSPPGSLFAALYSPAPTPGRCLLVLGGVGGQSPSGAHHSAISSDAVSLGALSLPASLG